jgi:hypothetical protein
VAGREGDPEGESTRVWLLSLPLSLPPTRVRVLEKVGERRLPEGWFVKDCKVMLASAAVKVVLDEEELPSDGELAPEIPVEMGLLLGSGPSGSGVTGLLHPTWIGKGFSYILKKHKVTRRFETV